MARRGAPRGRPVEPGFAEFSRYVRRSVVHVGAAFTEPDDDWQTVFLTEDGAGRLGVHGVRDTDPSLVGTVQLLPFLVEESGAVRAALVQSAWQVVAARRDAGLALDAIMAASRRQLHQHPQRTEAVIVQVAGRAAYEMWNVPIQRHDGAPPTLGEWCNVAAQVDVIGGRMVDPWVRALRPRG